MNDNPSVGGIQEQFPLLPTGETKLIVEIPNIQSQLDLNHIQERLELERRYWQHRGIVWKIVAEVGIRGYPH